MIDLTTLAGYPLQLDLEGPDLVVGGGVQFTKVTRRVSDLERVFFEPSSLPAEQALYWNYNLVHGGIYDQVFRDNLLTFGLVLLPAMKSGIEYVKTHGHYHSLLPGSQLGYPEVYTCYYGTSYLLMQHRLNGETLNLDECVIYKMVPGQSITIPPGYAHILINPSLKPALMAGLYSTQAGHLYQPILETVGAAYYMIEKGGQSTFIRNPHYLKVPAMRNLADLAETAFQPPDEKRPLWQSFVTDPGLYAFINSSELTEHQFPTKDLTR